MAALNPPQFHPNPGVDPGQEITMDIEAIRTICLPAVEAWLARQPTSGAYPEPRFAIGVEALRAAVVGAPVGSPARDFCMAGAIPSDETVMSAVETALIYLSGVPRSWGTERAEQWFGQPHTAIEAFFASLASVNGPDRAAAVSSWLS